MPFTVITLKKVPLSLRGDLTKWMQEIATGVYVGNFNARIREYLWKRVCNAIGTGEATLSYAYRNEIGYNFQTLNTEQRVIDSEGIPLVLWPEKVNAGINDVNSPKKGFSNAYKMHKAIRQTHPAEKNANNYSSTSEKLTRYVVLDLETTGLDNVQDKIIEVGAIKVVKSTKNEFHALIKIDSRVPDNIVKLTGITNEVLKDGQGIESVLKELMIFIGDCSIVGYNIAYDIKFLNAALARNDMPIIKNRTIDLLACIKHENLFQENYKLMTSLKAYGINAEVPHRALEDAKLICRLAEKVKIFQQMLV